MTYTIAGTYTTLVTLDAAIDNPTTITQVGRLTDGLEVSYQGLTVVNAGSITGSSGIVLFTGGSITNQSGGAIDGGYGVIGEAGAAMVVNAGIIAGSNRPGIALRSGGSVTNQSGGAISGNYGVVGAAGSVTVVNAGSITGSSSSGIVLFTGGSVTNQSGGTIRGAVDGIYGSYGATTVVNAGVIIGGGGDAVVLAAGYTDWLIIDPGAVFSGAVTGGNAIGATAISTLELASVGSAGTLTGLGTQFIDFAEVAVDAGAQWTLTGSNTIVAGGTLTDTGILIDTGTLTNAGIFSGELTLAPGGVLSNASSGTVTMPGGIAVYGAADGAATVVNAGVIAGGNGFRDCGIDLAGSGSVTNQSGGTISGYNGIYGTPDTVTIVNDGRIEGSSDDGVYFRYGGSVTNQSGGMISGRNGGVLGDYGGVVVVNAGGIAGPQEGVFLGFGGYVANLAGGTISGVYKGIFGDVAAVTVVNAGSIVGSNGNGIYVRAGGYITNQSGGVISGRNGIESRLTDVTVVNAGGITGSAGVGVYLDQSGSVTNQGGGAISGYFGIYGEGGVVAVTNAGNLLGNRAGIYLITAGSVTNQSGGAISASGFGIYAEYTSLTVVNAGAISGGIDAVRFAGGYSNRLVIDPGAVFSGGVVGGNPIGSAHVSTLELASAGSAGTLSGLGAQFVDFAQVTLDAGAKWTLAGSNALGSGGTITNAGTLTLSDATLSGAAALINNGAIVLDPSNMTIASLTGTGSFTIQAGSTLDVTGTIASTETIVFAGSGASLVLGTPDSAAGAVTGFAAGDTIDLAGVAPASVSDAGGRVSFTGGSFPLAATATPVIESDGNGGTNVTICFGVGTQISTPAGEVPVETLAIGDLVLTAHNGPRKVAWIGRGKVLATRAGRGAAAPVIVCRGALADNVPNRDLHVTKAHSLYIDDVLIPVEFLVNHRTILWDDRAQEVEIFHVELDSHDVLIANGAPAESFRDDGNRWLFQNARSGWDLRPQEPYSPVLTGGPIVDAVWRRLLDRAGPLELPPLTDDPDLHLLVDGTRADAVARRGSAYEFHLPHSPARVAIVSRKVVPSELGIARDFRSLGVALRRVTVQQGTRFTLFEAPDERLTAGFHGYEADCNLRWTDGHAELPAEAFVRFNKGAKVMLHLGGATQYPDDRASVSCTAA